MMGPHWNPMATEIAVVLQGRGMVRVVCSSVSNETGCRNMRFEVEEGDLLTLLNVYTAYNKNKTHSWCQKYFINMKAIKRATQIRKQMLGLMKKLNLSIESCNG